MKCRICRQKAVINLRQHNIGMCKTHFLAWVPRQTARAIQKYALFTKEDRILVAVSGGKDSLVLWDLLIELGYQADGVHIHLGIDEGTAYSDQSEQYSQEFADSRGLKLHVVNIQQEFETTIPDLALESPRGRGKPCSVCGLVKRHIMNRVARQGHYAVLATGHNLDDEAATLFGNTLNWKSEYLIRQGPVLAAEGGFTRKVKPLFRFYEREMAAYALLKGIAYIEDECPHAAGAKSIYYKEILNNLELDRPSAKLSFYLNFLQAKQAGLFAHQQQADLIATFSACKSCGQPTSAPEICSFCRLMATAKQSKGRETV